MSKIQTILAIGGLVLATKIWIDVCDLLKQNIRMQSYVKLSSCAVDIMKIIQDESHKSNKKAIK